MPPDSAGHRQTGSDGRHRLIGGSVLDSLLWKVCAAEAVVLKEPSLSSGTH